MQIDSHSDNSIIWGCKSWDELARMASLEQAGDQILVHRNFAISAVLSTSQKDDIWQAGSNIVLPTTAGVVSIVSTDADDAAGDTGAQTVLINGLDSNYEPILETVNLNGTNPVTTTNSYLRVNTLRVVSSGSSKHNEGAITASIGGNVQKYIAATDSVCHCSHFTIPNRS